jgi:hypothetical protein
MTFSMDYDSRTENRKRNEEEKAKEEINVLAIAHRTSYIGLEKRNIIFVQRPWILLLQQIILHVRHDFPSCKLWGLHSAKLSFHFAQDSALSSSFLIANGPMVLSPALHSLDLTVFLRSAKSFKGNYPTSLAAQYFILFYFNFVLLLTWRSSIRIFSQIWRHSKYESQKNLSDLPYCRPFWRFLAISFF